MANPMMPKPDIALKDFFRNNEIFAALFNGYFFHNHEVVFAKDLDPDDTSYSETIYAKGKNEKINKYRDNIRRTSLGYLVILGIENQDKIHYSMPLRKLLYDVLGYSAELSTKSNVQDKTEWTIDERLSKVKKGTKITPIITVVFYTGEDPWDGPRSLHEMMDIDERIKPFVPDYPLYVIDIGHDKNLSFTNSALEELKNILSSIYSKTADNNELEVDNSIIALAGILTGDKHLYLTASESKGGKQKMCKALEERDELIKKAKDIEFASERAKMDALLAEKDARIKELEEQLAAKVN